MDSASSPPTLKFGPYVLDLEAGELRKFGLRIRLQEKSLRLLAALVEQPGRVITREELHGRLWPDATFVDFETGLNTAVSKLRQALSDDAEQPKYIETIPRRGYRFLEQVERPAGTGLLKNEGVAQAVDAPAGSVSDALGERASLPLQQWPDLSRYVMMLALVVGIGGVTLVGFLLWRHFSAPTKASASRTMIVVLPFENLTGDSGEDYVTDGFTEEIITELGAVNQAQMGVIARTSAMTYKGQHKSIKEIASELGVDYVLEGSVRKTATGLRVTAQLIRAEDQTHLWAQNYDRSFGGLVQIQGDVAQAVAKEIQIKLTPQIESSLTSAREVTPESYRAFLQGRYFLAMRSGEGLNKAVTAFQESIARDPGYAPAYAGLADAYNLLIYYGYPPGRKGIPLARAAAEKAVQLDPNLGRGHASLAYVHFMWEWHWGDADREFQKALQLDSNYSSAHHWYAQYLAAMGRREEALAEIGKAKSLDPQSLIVDAARGYILYFARDYTGAIYDCQKVLQRNPNFMVGHAVLGLALEAEDQEAKAISEFQKALELSGSRPAPYLDYLGHAYAVTGQTKEAAAILEELDQQSRGGSGGPGFRAATLAALGKKEEALGALEQGSVQGDGPLIYLGVDPRYDALHQDSRYQRLTTAIGISH